MKRILFPALAIVWLPFLVGCMATTPVSLQGRPATTQQNLATDLGPMTVSHGIGSIVGVRFEEGENWLVFTLSVINKQSEEVYFSADQIKAYYVPNLVLANLENNVGDVQGADMSASLVELEVEGAEDRNRRLASLQSRSEMLGFLTMMTGAFNQASGYTPPLVVTPQQATQMTMASGETMGAEIQVTSKSGLKSGFIPPDGQTSGIVWVTGPRFQDSFQEGVYLVVSVAGDQHDFIFQNVGGKR